MPASRKRCPARRVRDLPVPEAIGIPDADGAVTAWDCRAAHELCEHLGAPDPDCDDACRRRHHIAPPDGGVFRHAIAPAPLSRIVDDAAVERWLVDHPRPLVGFGAVGWYEPAPGRSVVDVVRAMVRERLVE
jgi:hypothetical protein